MLQRVLFLTAALSVAGLCAGNATAGKGGGHGGGGGHAGGMGGAHMGGAHMGGAHMGGAHMGGHPGSIHSGGAFFGSPFYGGFYGGFYPYGYGYGGLYNFGGGYGGGYGYGSPYYGSSYGSSIYAPRYSYYPDVIVQPQAPVRYASIRVILPDGAAKVLFDGNETKQAGTDRYFYTPDLDPAGGPYSYRVRASWTVDGQPMTQERVVEVAPGQTSTADFR